MKKLLFLSLKDICYNSTAYFETRISDELSTLGIQVTHIKLPKASDMAYAVLKPYFDADYDAVIDINSRIPVMMYNNAPLLGSFQIPVWHYILDHPMYHYEALSSKLPDYNIICLDINHAQLIKDSFPHIKQVCVLPLAADTFFNTNPFEENASDYFNRPDNIIFTGTYTDPVKTSLLYSRKQAIDNHPLFTTLLDMPLLTQEAAVRLLIKDKLIDAALTPIEYLYNNFLIDVFLQAVIREEIITQIIKQHLPITIYGHGWDAFADKCDILAPGISRFLNLRPEVTYSRLPCIYSSARLSINQMPWFKNGIHDRIPLSLRNGCICISDESSYLTDTLKLSDDYGIYTYSLEAIYKLPDIINKLMQRIDNKDSLLTAQLCKGYEYASKNFTWNNWVSRWLSYINTNVL